MAITPLPTAPTISDPATFEARADALIAALPTLVAEVNATEVSMNSIAAGGAYSIPYTFDSTITDADPGAGKLRLSSATQNASTVLRLDPTSSLGQDWTGVIDTFDSSTSLSKGQIRLVKMGDATKWLTFNVTARAAPAGYRNLTVVNTGGNAASPFTNSDSVMLFFTRTGDKGDVGPASAVPATTAEVKTGADSTKPVTPSTLLLAVGFSAYAQTADQTITQAGALTIAHGLGRIPVLMHGFLRCVTTEANYAVGDIVPVPLGSMGAAVYSATVVPDATNLNVRYANNATPFYVIDKTTGSPAGITPAKWSFFLRAFA
jgi:hypothetical protein